MTTLNLSTNYLQRGVRSPGQIVELVTEMKNKHGLRFDTVVGTGMSGAIIVPHVGRSLGLNWALVRKPNDGAHTNNPIEGDLGDRWLFLDDLVSSGATQTRVMAVVKEVCARHKHPIKFEGTITYDPPKYLPYGKEE